MPVDGICSMPLVASASFAARQTDQISESWQLGVKSRNELWARSHAPTGPSETILLKRASVTSKSLSTMLLVSVFRP